jgi:hypothetical protein
MTMNIPEPVFLGAKVSRGLAKFSTTCEKAHLAEAQNFFFIQAWDQGGQMRLRKKPPKM